MTGEFRSGAHAELAVDPAEVAFDGAHAHEQGGGDFAVGLSRADQGGDAFFDGGQVAGGGAPADAGELYVGLRCLDRGAQLNKDGACSDELSPGIAPVAGPPQETGEQQASPRLLERHRQPLMVGQG